MKSYPIMISGLILLGTGSVGAAPWGRPLSQKPIPEQELVIPVKKDGYRPKSCLDDFGSSPYLKVFFNRADSKMYFLDQGPTIAQLEDKVLPYDDKQSSVASKAVAPPKLEYRRSALYEISYKNWQVNKLAYVELPTSHQILMAGRPANMLYSLSFEGGSDCGKGQGTVFGVNFKLALAEREVKFKQGDFTAVSAVSGSFVYDNNWAQVFEFAAGRFQTRRALFSIPKEEWPVFIDAASNRIAAWVAGEGTISSPRGIKMYAGSANPEFKVRFRTGDKLLKRDDRMGVLSLDPKANQLSIMEVRRLTKVNEAKSFALTLPQRFSVEEAMVDVHFDAKIAVVQASTEMLRKTWNRVFVYQYKDAKLLTEFTPAANHVLDNAFIDPKGTVVFFIERDPSRNLASRIHAYHTRSGKWKLIDLGQVR